MIVKNVIEGYIGIWIFLLLFYLCLGFTSLNMNIVQARNLMSSIKAQVSASNGAIIPEGQTEYTYDSTDNNISIANNGYEFSYTVTRESPLDIDAASENSGFIYNYVYRVTMYYKYHIPLFGRQTYPISVIVY